MWQESCIANFTIAKLKKSNKEKEMAEKLHCYFHNPKESNKKKRYGIP